MFGGSIVWRVVSKMFIAQKLKMKHDDGQKATQRRTDPPPCGWHTHWEKSTKLPFSKIKSGNQPHGYHFAENKHRDLVAMLREGESLAQRRRQQQRQQGDSNRLLRFQPSGLTTQNIPSVAHPSGMRTTKVCWPNFHDANGGPLKKIENQCRLTLLSNQLTCQISCAEKLTAAFYVLQVGSSSLSAEAESFVPSTLRGSAVAAAVTGADTGSGNSNVSAQQLSQLPHYVTSCYPFVQNTGHRYGNLT